MNNYKQKIEKDVQLRKYLDLINKIAKAEYKILNAQHLIEYGELVNIGIQTVDILIDNNKMNEYNESYIATAVKWAIRNELRRRYRWHGVRTEIVGKASDEDKTEIREAIYKTILSTDELIESDKPFEVKDIRKTPEENIEFIQISQAIKHAISNLPRRERDLIEAKFFKEKKLHELSEEFMISPSRISRIIKSGLDKIKEELSKSDIF
ncbi:MAG: sigma-70 family RNA polymerase sigma factor [Cyanobacteria bacterium SIG30]|nr:sigma-70 family RNA polymerase sigma factor [Cyanobacteria bacterium SIG30]